MIRRILQGMVVAAFIVFLPALGRPEALTASKMWCLWVLGVLANTFQPSYKAIDPNAPALDQHTATQILWSVYLTQLATILEAMYVRYPASLAWTPVAGAALAAMVFGWYLRTHAVLILGASFTWHVHVEPGQKVITGGPYRFIRHPSYAGAWLTYAGTPVFLGCWWSLAFTIPVLTAAFVRRIRLEEVVLERELGQEYTEYSKRTARLCPGIW
jgi:protein-S-isoprenylcysteine O-methyltransferase